MIARTLVTLALAAVAAVSSANAANIVRPPGQNISKLLQTPLIACVMHPGPGGTEIKFGVKNVGTVVIVNGTEFWLRIDGHRMFASSPFQLSHDLQPGTEAAVDITMSGPQNELPKTCTADLA